MHDVTHSRSSGSWTSFGTTSTSFPGPIPSPACPRTARGWRRSRRRLHRGTVAAAARNSLRRHDLVAAALPPGQADRPGGRGPRDRPRRRGGGRVVHVRGEHLQQKERRGLLPRGTIKRPARRDLPLGDRPEPRAWADPGAARACDPCGDPRARPRTGGIAGLLVINLDLDRRLSPSFVPPSTFPTSSVWPTSAGTT